MRKMDTILICTEEGHFKQWILYSDGMVEYGAIGKGQQRKHYGLQTGRRKAKEKLRGGRGTGQYQEYTADEYEQFMKAYGIVCKYGPLALSFLNQAGVEEKLEAESKKGRRIII